MKRTRKRASGSAYRKQKKERTDAARKHSQALEKWLTGPLSTPTHTTQSVTSESDSDLSDVSETFYAQSNSDFAENAGDTENSCSSDNMSQDEADQRGQSEETTGTTSKFCPAIPPADSVDFPHAVHDDLGYFPLGPIPDNLRMELVQRGTGQIQHKNGPFVVVRGRSLSAKWFSKELQNGQLVPRSWLVYSPFKEALFCFCCVLFGRYSRKDCQYSSFGNVNVGFRSWQKLSPRVANHEASAIHRQAFLEWKDLEKRITGTCSGLIDERLQAQIRREQQTWRDILDRIVSTVKFLAEQNLALRGHREFLDDDNTENPGNFLALLRYLGKYDPVVRQHLDHASLNPRSPSYLSHEIQNEFIELLGKSIKKSIVSDIKSAKYFSIMFDTTPDLAHREQMSEIIRYVVISKSPKSEVKVKESFLGFVEVHKKTADGLADSITDVLRSNNLQIADCRGQSYDNAVVMAGRKSGVQ